MYADAMAQSRMDLQLKTTVDAVLERMGLNGAIVIRMLYKKIAELGRLPFEVGVSKEELAKIRFRQTLETVTARNAEREESEPSMEEIDSFIAKARSERRTRLSK